MPNIEYFDQPDRRKENIPMLPEYDRRLAERVSVLEVRADNLSIKTIETQDLLQKFISRFDNHTVAEENNTQELSTTLVKVTNTVDNLANEIKRTNDTLISFAGKVEITHDKVSKWDTIAKTLIKTATVISIVIGAVWTVYTFVDSKYQQQEQNYIQPHVQGK